MKLGDKVRTLLTNGISFEGRIWAIDAANQQALVRCETSKGRIQVTPWTPFDDLQICKD